MKTLVLAAVMLLAVVPVAAQAPPSASAQAAQAAPAQQATPPALPSCPELAAALQAVARNDVRLRDWPDVARYREANRMLAAPGPFLLDLVLESDTHPERVGNTCGQ